MTALRFIPIQLTFCLALGICLARHLELDAFTCLFLLLCSFSWLAIRFHKRDRRWYSYELMVGLTVVLLGIFSTELTREKTAVLPGGYQQWHLRITKVMKSRSYADQYQAEILHMNTHRSRGKLLLNLPPAPPGKSLKIDQEILAMGRIQPIAPPLNPHQFNYQKYMQGLGISYSLRPGRESFKLLPGSGTSLAGVAAQFRNTLIDSLRASGIKGQELAIIQALLLGDRNAIDEDVYEAYKDAGAIHILAVSGLHIGIILWIFNYLLGFLDRSSGGATLKLVLLVFILWSYAIIAGLSPSVTRAVSMFSFVAYALYLNRPSNSFNIMALSMFFILLLFDPNLLFQVGFQLSYAAVLAILWGYPKIARIWQPKNLFLRRAWQLTVVSFTAQLGVFPLSLYYFHQFPGLFFLSNLVIIPFLGIILGSGLVITGWAAAGELPQFLSEFYELMIRTQNQVVQWISSREQFVFREISFDLPMLLFSAVLVILLFSYLERPALKKAVVFCTVFLFLQAYTAVDVYRTRKSEALWVMHRPGQTQVLHRVGQQLTSYSSGNIKVRTTEAFRTGEKIRQWRNDSLGNFYRYGDADLVILEQNSPVYDLPVFPKWVLLTNSPGFHMDRWLEQICPQQVIADGSNYYSSVERWRISCMQRGIPFHYTGKDGAFLLEPEP
ncbi:ComEC/Rec2 family competence protein [Zeaxanthinibacter enoshimensis]|uniref:Competence protein ComEC n=1 Tax=Zeaxanthinibacter enoshimensis TaxID=392009 RepID=A0A4R6TSL7_9FLAO|nr:ComEC/Rec2 family competence protein [Zeaxanthinibacter enoshimensis]TDQ33317.1 competence protein ComEC [Zeaxanthinibacter enoshimensis]